MSVRFGRAPLVAAATLLAVAIYFVLVELHRADIVAANDIYAYFVPNILHALHSLADGGKGLLWNPLQACGEPFFANTVNGLLYPFHLLFLVLDANTAVHVVLIINMALGAIGMLLLGRELGLGWLGAFAGALAFELGDPMAQLTSWSPMHNGPWVWLPWVLLFVERLLRAPTRRDVVGLTVAIALEILPGFVLITAFTYQLIAFRVAWELLRRRDTQAVRSALAVGAGLTLAPLLLAVQLAPAAEYAQQSFRVIHAAAGGGGAVPTWVRLPLIGVAAALKRLAIRDLPIPFSFGLVVLAGVAALSPRTRPLAIFYLAVGTLYAVLGFGNATPLYHAFVKLPPGAATLRLPYRFFWMTGFCLAVLAGLAVHGLAQKDASVTFRWTVVAMVVAIGLGLYLTIPGGLQWPEIAAGGTIIGAVFAAALWPTLVLPSTLVVVGAVGFNLLSLPLRWPGQLLTSTDPLFTHAQTFAALRETMTPQDRIFIVSTIDHSVTFRLMQKSASVMRVSGFHDYEALLGYRYSRYFMTMWDHLTIRRKTRADAQQLLPQHRLLDVAAVHYLVAAPGKHVVDDVEGLRLFSERGAALKLIINEAALPRARYVPRIDVISDPEKLLQRLVQGQDDLRHIAFVETAPPSGFLGAAESTGRGSVQFVTNDPEDIAIEVEASAPGFVVLADTHYPGWEATVNGDPVPILRANYMFRLVEVPAGTSRVAFRYRPFSVVLGACVSFATLLVVTALWWTGRSRRPGRS